MRSCKSKSKNANKRGEKKKGGAKKKKTKVQIGKKKVLFDFSIRTRVLVHSKTVKDILYIASFYYNMSKTLPCHPPN